MYYVYKRYKLLVLYSCFTVDSTLFVGSIVVLVVVFFRI